MQKLEWEISDSSDLLGDLEGEALGESGAGPRFPTAIQKLLADTPPSCLVARVHGLRVHDLHFFRRP